VGIACGIKNSGIGNGVPEQGRVLLRVEKDQTITLFNGFSEMGQGLFTVLCQIAAEVTGLPLATFVPRVDTSVDCATGQTTASRGALLSGNAAEKAARFLRADLDLGQTIADLVGKTYAGEFVITDTTSLESTASNPKTHTTYGFAAQLVELNEAGRIAKVIAAHDVGRALNPAFCAGQIEGAVHMGLGYALTENLLCEEGRPQTCSLRDIGVLRARDMPPVEVILIEEAEPEGPFGAKGIGEIGLVPTAAAVAGALRAFDGVRRYELPLKDAPAALAMSVGPHHAHHVAPPSERMQKRGGIQ
jgi:xanthine dehydrogenase molybdenum-binding subunit